MLKGLFFRLRFLGGLDFYFGPRVWMKWLLSLFLSIWCCVFLAVLGSHEVLLLALCSLQFPFDPGGAGGWLYRSPVVHYPCFSECCKVQKLSGVFFMLFWCILQRIVLSRSSLLNNYGHCYVVGYAVITCVSCCWGFFQLGNSSFADCMLLVIFFRILDFRMRIMLVCAWGTDCVLILVYDLAHIY